MTTLLKSYLNGRWQAGGGKPLLLVNPSTEEVVAQTSTEGLQLGEAVRYARELGGAGLRNLNFAQRGERLQRLAQCLIENREELIGLGMINAGNTRSDAKFDIDGAAATLQFYAELGTKLGAQTVISDGEGIPLGRSARLYGQHIYVSRRGVAVHINAFNFPAWGMAEKLAVAFLAGMPVVTKPATATALMAHRIVELWVSSGALPEGSLTFVCGGAGDLLSHLGGQDVLAFTGSGATATSLRQTKNLASENVHVNVEADSLNSAVLGRDVQLGSETLNLFLNEVSKEMTQKAGQKCTAVRRIFVPQALLEEVKSSLVERLSAIKVGAPNVDTVNMGPLATEKQLIDVRAGIRRLAEGAEIAFGGDAACRGQGAPENKGYFIAPTLLVRRAPQASDVVNQLEVFGPVATLMPYHETKELLNLIAAGGGGLVSSIYSDDKSVTQELVEGMAAFHGRLTLGSEKLAGQSIGPGTVMPQLLHGGPGRAGGGEELGGMRGLSLYMQRVALQGYRSTVELIAGIKKESSIAS